MQPEIYINFLFFANKLADASGDILRRSFEQPIKIEQKQDTSPVTQADKEVELCLRQMIEENFPDHGIIGEEFGNLEETTQVNSVYKWVIDPIDGTKSFIAGYPIFTTLISLLHNDIPVIGVIDQPVLRQRWAAAAPLKSKEKINKNKLLSQANLATTSTQHFTLPQAEKFKNLSKNCANTVLGGDAYAYAMLSCGKLDLVVDAGMKPYDFCALAPIIEDAGGIITDWDGNKLTLHSDGSVLASSNKELHAAALKFLCN